MPPSPAIHERIDAAARLMSEFAARTGITESTGSGARYLWTDAYAVFALLGLHRQTGEPRYLDWTLHLADRVHRTLGRYREDDPRAGWISGLDEAAGARHPTRGGLRIGKPLAERGPDEPYDERLEWERDGQYFHYLTKWMQALHLVATVTGDRTCDAWARELAVAAHRGFVHRLAPGGAPRMFWKMSVDLSRPLVPSMGQHDPIDGLATCRLLESTADEDDPALHRAAEDFRRMCTGVSWTTGDELGIGGLLADIGHLVHVIASDGDDDTTVLDDAVRDAMTSLNAFATRHPLDRPAETRLAFRELGLSAGLRGVPSIRAEIVAHAHCFPEAVALLDRVDVIARATPWAGRIERFWLGPAHQRVATWTSHLDINTVMLAASLVPAPHFAGHPTPAPAHPAVEERG